MAKPEIVLIAAMDENYSIGYNGEIPWPPIKEDFRRFRSLTLNHAVIMGRKTFDSILQRNGKPLDRRHNIVLTRNPDFDGSAWQNVIGCSNLEWAVALGQKQNPDGKIYVIGGGEIYRLFFDRASRLEITHVRGTYPADTFFPKVDRNIWEELNQEDIGGCNLPRETAADYYFRTYARK